MTRDEDAGPAGVAAGPAFDTLNVPEVEEAAGELHRRISVAFRHLGEQRADRPGEDGRSARWRVAALCAVLELAAATLGAIAAGARPASERTDRHPATVAAVMYAAATIPALLTRLEQDRRLLASLTRHLESRLAEEHPTPWGHVPLRRLVSEAAVVEAAGCAQALERPTESS